MKRHLTHLAVWLMLIGVLAMLMSQREEAAVPAAIGLLILGVSK